MPTWNYTAVHTFGPIELIDGGEPLLEVLKESVQASDDSVATSPWAGTDQSERSDGH